MNTSVGDLPGNCSTPADYQFYLFPAVYSLVMALGLPGNVGALYMFIFKITPRTSSNVYVINLALADTAILCTLPFKIHYFLNKNDWVFGDMACRITGTLFFANIYISIAFMTCICVDRYTAVTRPHIYLRLRNSCYTVVVSVAVWVVAGVAVLSFIRVGPLDSKPGGGLPHRRSCFENFSKHEWDRRVAPYSLFSLVFGSLLPSVVILVCYPLVARRIAIIRTNTARGALRVIYIILAITLLCFLPYHVVHFLHLLRRQGAIHYCPHANAIYNARQVTLALVSLNSCLDPLLYYFTTSRCNWSPSMARFRWIWARRNRGRYTIAVGQ
ncbi:lysophosphatidic acid receptor 6-like [Salmo trutta]|uniref:lysophosphatidic acid receptor 6-like n=1 Tax=Salmo trutta TaxID=8032 RepID=UPI00113278D2|nr:lysophosphatidic acid receptor 6-like [Salmo trutta]XP_029580224.1 lysophosphatidic acid receptor 6-like [Salmo trutta]